MCGIVFVIFHTNTVLYLFIPVLASQSKFLIVISFPPYVRLPHKAKNEQCILFRFKNYLISLTQ
jgi:hypothetical protein